MPGKKKHNLPPTYYRKLLLSIRHEQSQLLDELANELGVSFSDYLEKERPYMNEEQISALAQKGFTFGGHSANHPLFSDLSEEQQLMEVYESVKSLKARLPFSQPVFSFPFTDFGVKQSFFERLSELNTCKASFGCAGIKRDSAPYHLQRIPVELSAESMKSLLKKEYLYYIFLKLTGKGTLKR